LELGGVVTAARALVKRSELYGDETIWSRIKAWLLRFPMLRQNKVIPISGAGAVSTAGSLVAAKGDVRLPPGASIEDRVDRLERQMREEIPQQFVEVRRYADQGDSKLRKEVLEKIDEMGTAVEVEREKIRTANTSVGWEIVGFWWVVLGLTLATIPQLVLSIPGISYLVDFLTIPVSCPL
jgi:hypothetical protein